MVEDLAGDARTGDERDEAQTVTAVGADENVDAVDAMDAAAEGGSIESAYDGGACWFTGPLFPATTRVGIW